MSAPVEMDAAAAAEHGLSHEEFERICEILGRKPNRVELGIFSVMWSEHCSYKNSISQLKTLPRSGGRLLVGAGEENAGLVDIGDGLAICFKIESHNHPSAVEPFQGAATGVGGILRDIFTMGARPIAALNSLRFGPLEDPKVRHLFEGVVAGIAHYGNCFGVPTVGGEVYFDESYRGNPLVNAMAVGLVEVGQTASATATGEGNPVLIVGSATGRDGIHGATFASEDLSADSEAKRPNVQVGDPFAEKLLLEATLEAISSKALVGIQDMGAAGITCSSSEMSAKGESGIELNLDLVPTRESHMTAYDILLSESQERMLLVAEAGRESEVQAIFERWDLHAVVIGRVTGDGLFRVQQGGATVAEVPSADLVLGGGAPVYTREQSRPAYLDQTTAFDLATLPEPTDLDEILQRLLSSPTIASKRWVFEQYDTQVRGNSIGLPGRADAALVRIKGTTKGIALTTDCNSRYVYLDPRRGAAIAVAEAARNVACTGARPLAITNCLNFGNPFKPEVYYQFAQAVAGMGEACRAFDTPVTGGNVSFYNESPDGAVFPTPTIGMLGLLDNIDRAVGSTFQSAGDRIAIIGGIGTGELGGSEYIKLVTGRVTGVPPALNLDLERRLHDALIELANQSVVQSAHDCAEGGLAVALVESCFGEQTFGFKLTIQTPPDGRADAFWFGESQGRVVVSYRASVEDQLWDICDRFGVPVQPLGTVTLDRYQFTEQWSGDPNHLREQYESAIPKIMSGETGQTV